MDEFIKKLIERLEGCDDDCGCGVMRVYEAVDIVTKLAEEYNNGWIPCSERLPEEDVDVLVCIKDYDDNYYYDVAYFHIVWHTEVGGMYSEVIAWQPLPAPYQQKRNESVTNCNALKMETADNDQI